MARVQHANNKKVPVRAIVDGDLFRSERYSFFLLLLSSFFFLLSSFFFLPSSSLTQNRASNLSILQDKAMFFLGGGVREGGGEEGAEKKRKKRKGTNHSNPQLRVYGTHISNTRSFFLFSCSMFSTGCVESQLWLRTSFSFS